MSAGREGAREWFWGTRKAVREVRAGQCGRGAARVGVRVAEAGANCLQSGLV